MTMNLKSIFLLAAVVLLMAGCASSPEQEARKQIAKENAERIERQQDQAEQRLGDLPDWVTRVPVPDANGYYGVGSGISNDLVWAARKARQESTFTALQTMRNEMSGFERTFIRDAAAGETMQQSELVIDSIVDRVKISGATIIDTYTMVVDGKYEVYTLAMLPIDALDAAFAESKASARTSEAAAKFAELEARLDKRRAERLQEQTLEPQHSNNRRLSEAQAEAIKGADTLTYTEDLSGRNASMANTRKQ
ncbi:LPP20 family lipoprotein [Ferrimonas kyonanensis]|uniref:LPP20 family lipoprotein n=1 Tax=Ferrimonas kyonanensis TaxID=364763 RepID=UPI00040EC0D0|nr:LPP20 family lipoprotein [Ferrimonas kyonanensis]